MTGEATIINIALNELCSGYNLSGRELEPRSDFDQDEIRSVLWASNDAVRRQDTSDSQGLHHAGRP